MDTLLDVIGAQVFVFGFLHADPHPGNGESFLFKIVCYLSAYICVC
jgi:hypothetical protein